MRGISALNHEPAAGAGLCLNCGAAAPGHYCQECGQHTQLHVPSATEFLHEFVGHYVALEGKLWATLRRLILHPGALTNDYIAGRRVRYVEPLRVYLTFSILFFALFKLPGYTLFKFDAHNQAAWSTMAADPELRALRKPLVAAAGVAAGPGPATPAPAPSADDDLMGAVKQALPSLAPRLRHIESLPAAEVGKVVAEGFLHYAPYAMFLLLPVFALYLKLLYMGRQRRYGEHFLFALHSNAFAFLTFGLIVVTPWHWLADLLFFWMVAYLPWAMQRVYGGSWSSTLWRWLTLILLHLMSMTLVMLAVLAYAALHE